jgi:hypothetical protein
MAVDTADLGAIPIFSSLSERDLEQRRPLEASSGTHQRHRLDTGAPMTSGRQWRLKQ